MNKCSTLWFGWFSLTVCPFTISLGLCPDWEAWDPNQPVQNAREAMQQADDWLGVPQVHWVGHGAGGVGWRRVYKDTGRTEAVG